MLCLDRLRRPYLCGFIGDSAAGAQPGGGGLSSSRRAAVRGQAQSGVTVVQHSIA